MIELNEQKQREIVVYFRNLISERKQANKELIEEKLPEYWERYLGTYSSKKNKSFPWEGSSDVHIPFSSFATTTLESRFVNALFNSRKFISLTPLTNEAIEPARKIEDAFNFHITKKVGIFNIVCDMLQGILVEGTRFLKVYPYEYTRKKYKYALIRKIVKGMEKILGYETDMFNNLIKRQVEEKVFIPKWEEISVKDLFWEKGAVSIENASWIAQRLYFNTAEIKKKNWINLDKIENIQLTKKRTDEVEKTKSEFIGVDTNEWLDEDDYEIYEIWTTYDLGDGDNEYQFVVDIKNGILFYADENKFFDKRKPFVSIPCYRIAGSILGQSLPQRLALLNDELDTIHNIIIDNSILANAITYMYVPNKGFDPARIKIKPGVAIPVQSLDGVIKQFEFRNVSLDLYRLENFVINLLQKMSFVSDYALGEEAVERPTARGTLAMLQEFAINVNFLIKNIQDGLTKAVYQTLQLLYEFMPQEGIAYFSEQGEERLTREDLEYLDDMEITVLADAVRAMKDMDKQIAITLLQVFGADQTGEVDKYKIKKYFIETIAPHLAKDILRTPEEVRQLQMAQQELLDKMQVLKQKEDELMTKEGMLQEKELENELREAGYDEKEIQRRLKDFRRTYIRNVVKAQEEEE
ncbi:MAG: hypothetical protein J7L34_00080 [Thermotogaceae bacterium]|nr:hypothetical protein [Thermotogaceae bacterium]